MLCSADRMTLRTYSFVVLLIAASAGARTTRDAAVEAPCASGLTSRRERRSESYKMAHLQARFCRPDDGTMSTEEVNYLVDSGAVYSLAPAKTLRKPGIRKARSNCTSRR